MERRSYIYSANARAQNPFLLRKKDERWNCSYTCAICAHLNTICWCILHKLQCGSCQLSWICVKLQQYQRSFPLGNTAFFVSLIFILSFSLPLRNYNENEQHTNDSIKVSLKNHILCFFFYWYVYGNPFVHKQSNRSYPYGKNFNEQFWLLRRIIPNARARHALFYSIEIDVTLKSDEWIEKKKLWIH